MTVNLYANILLIFFRRRNDKIFTKLPFPCWYVKKAFTIRGLCCRVISALPRDILRTPLISSHQRHSWKNDSMRFFLIANYVFFTFVYHFLVLILLLIKILILQSPDRARIFISSLTFVHDSVCVDLKKTNESIQYVLQTILIIKL